MCFGGGGESEHIEIRRAVKISVRKFTLLMLQMCNLRPINKLWVHFEGSGVPKIIFNCDPR
jgi:hypothetical protein